ncbi:MAG: hypothetical protein JSW58_09060 [Candidatus Latescibacterota bacterium]|nr:MAG: hypothetical protein JSW58_09060 [Candidatus Latescibacterota bacterium]
MRLKNATRWAILAICYLFLSKTVATFFPEPFRNLAVARVTIVLSTLASIAVVYFYSSFYQDYVRDEQTGLKNATMLAIIGTAAMALLHIKGLLLVFDAQVPRFLTKSHVFEVVVPWVSSIIGLVFFAVFCGETAGDRAAQLKKAIRFAVIGSSIGVVERTFLLYRYLQGRDTISNGGLSPTLHFISLPIIAMAVIAVLYFFVTFHRFQSIGESRSLR